ncbi:MAG: hypothetical protein ABR613_13375 [Actinomycetota bacterium]
MKRHRFDPFSFVFGITFSGPGAAFLDSDVDVADLTGAGWLPLPALVAGLLLLAVGLDRSRGGRAVPPAEAAPDAGDESGRNGDL